MWGFLLVDLMQEAKNTHLIFDFDGTLVDSLGCALNAFNALAADFGCQKVSMEELEGLKNLNSRALIKRLKIPLHKIPAVLYKARKHMRHEMHRLQPFPGIVPMLNELSASGCSLGIVTSNAKKNVVSWLEHHEISTCFHFVISAPSYFGKGKTLKKVIKKNQMDANHVFYIGDETRDIDAAKQCGVSSIAVTWGFNSEKIIIESNPHYLVRVPADLLAILNFRSQHGCFI